MERAIRYSFSNNLNLHTSIGGKYAELFVASELWRHGPRLAGERGKVRGVKNPRGCDIVLAGTGRRLEVKWAMLHHRGDDPFFRGSGIPFWGWGFSSGKQFIERRFDYCILLAAKEDEAHPQHIFVIKCEEMTEEAMGGKRDSGVARDSFYIEYSQDKQFYFRRRWWPKGPSPLEGELLENRIKYEERWSQLKRWGS